MEKGGGHVQWLIGPHGCASHSTTAYFPHHTWLTSQLSPFAVEYLILWSSCSFLSKLSPDSMKGETPGDWALVLEITEEIEAELYTP